MAPKDRLTAEEKDRERRLAWFRQARFGMFITWGLHAQLGRHEWVMNRERIPVKEYEKLADTWKPGPSPARRWAKLAKEAGMRYMVLTTKHHEGFCLFDTELTDYNSVKRGPGRDLVAEYVEAARAEGLGVGFYYSLADWHHPDGLRCAKNEKGRRRFVDYTHGLIRELLTNYGKIDLLWYDGAWPLDAEGWEYKQLNRMVQELQPDILTNDLGSVERDFGVSEAYEHKTMSPQRMWELCMPLNESWGYTPIDRCWKSSWEVLSVLRRVAMDRRNLLLNIGPAPDGTVPRPCVTALRQVGEWLSQYGEAIYEATDPMVQDFQVTGSFTRKGDTLYFLAGLSFGWARGGNGNGWVGPELVIGGLTCTVLEARLLHGKKLKFTQTRDRLVISGLPREAPNPLATVIELKVKGKPQQILGPGMAVPAPKPKEL